MAQTVSFSSRLAILETLVGIETENPADNKLLAPPSSPFSSSVLEQRINILENLVSKTDISDGGHNTAYPTLETMWSEINQLQMKLMPLSDACSFGGSTTTNDGEGNPLTVDPFKLELINTVYSDLEETADHLSAIDNIMNITTNTTNNTINNTTNNNNTATSGNIIDGDVYNLTSSKSTETNPTSNSHTKRLDAITMQTRELVNRTAGIQERVDLLLAVNEGVIDKGNRAFLIVHEKLGFLEEKERLKV